MEWTLLLILSLVSLLHSSFPSPAETKLGLIEQDPNLLRVCEYAIKRAHDDHVCTEPIRIINASGCSGTILGEGTANAARLFLEDNVGGLISSQCADESLEIARLSYFANVPVFNRIGSSKTLFNNHQNPTVIDASMTTVVGYTLAIEKLMTQFNFNSVSLFGPNDSFHRDNEPLHKEISTLLKHRGLNTTEFNIVIDKVTTNDFLSAIDLTIIVITGNRQSIKALYNRLSFNAIINANFLVVLICEETPSMCVAEVESAIRTSGTFVLTFNDESSASANKELATHVEGLDPSLHTKSLALYDSCYAFCLGTSRTSTSIPNGLNFINNIKGKTFKSLTREIAFDSTPAILRPYALYKLNKNIDNFSVVAEFLPRAVESCSPAKVSTCFELAMSITVPHFWTASNVELVVCNFQSKGCGNTYVVPLVSVLLAVVAFGSVAIAFYCYRRRMRLEIYRLHWKIHAKSFKIIDNPTGGLKSSSKAKYTKRRTINSYILLGSTKAEYIELVQRHKVEFTKEEFSLLKELKKASHDNLSKFLGIHYNETNRFLFLNSYVERATLDEILKNIEQAHTRNGLDFDGFNYKDPFTGRDNLHDEELTVDMMFKSGFIHDIIKGLTYLHKIIGPHGWLSTHTCLIDANWVLKLTNFGVGSLLHKYTENSTLLTEKNIPFSHYIAIAPEHLKGLHIGNSFPSSSKEGDVYSLAIIACQVLFNTDPYTDSLLLTHDILVQIGEGILRPQVPSTTTQFEKSLKDFIEPCYHSNPKARISLRQVSDSFNKVFQKSRGNLVDQMLQRNAQYASQLETTVNQRTQELQGAQLTTYKLLCELLPRTVADKLRMGIQVEPRSYDSATVLFCQICQFQSFLVSSTAEQIIRFLNNVFTLFDEVIREEDAYKVETTGETYMVASGVPTENENRHVFIIADIALKIRDATHKYSDYKPRDWNLEVRMGFHCGPIATGVIGLKSPRYCLFGDTVNFASRMQSNCAPNQIQLSEVTANMLMDCDKYTLTRRGVVKVKGKGNVNTYWLNEHTESKKDI